MSIVGKKTRASERLLDASVGWYDKRAIKKVFPVSLSRETLFGSSWKPLRHFRLSSVFEDLLTTPQVGFLPHFIDRFRTTSYRKHPIKL